MQSVHDSAPAGVAYQRRRTRLQRVLPQALCSPSRLQLVRGDAGTGRQTATRVRYLLLACSPSGAEKEGEVLMRVKSGKCRGCFRRACPSCSGRDETRRNARV